MQEPGDYLYEVFVSYRHRPDDERWARRLQEVLETFETPRELVAEGGRARLGKVFVDDTEMAAGPELSRTIKTALWSSKWLIVVCSPDTPGSDWVRQEINLFRNAWDRRERTLALLTAGTPAQSSPPELRELRTLGTGLNTTTEVVEPAGADVTEVQDKTEAERTDLARDRLAATQLGCDLGALRYRQEERVRRETTSLFFHDMVRRRGVPEGVGEVTTADQRRRRATLRFDRRGGLVRTIERINGSGFPVENDDGICRWDVSWRADETIEAIDHRNRYGDTLLREQFNRDATVVDFFHDDQTARAQGGLAAAGFDISFSWEARDELRKKKTRIVRRLVTYDEHGFERRIRYASDGFNTPAEDALGAHGEVYERDAAGLAITVSWLDARGGPFLLRNGVARISRDYDQTGREICEAFVGETGSPRFGQDGFSQATSEYDQFGNLIQCAYFGVDGVPVLHKDGFARVTQAYDARGNLVEWACFAIDGKPILLEDGYAGYTQSYDARGNAAEVAYFAIDGKPVLYKDGNARCTLGYDARGNVVEAAYFGLDGETVLVLKGYSTVRIRWDHFGRRIERSYFGPNGEALNRFGGYHRVEFLRDRFGDVIEKRFFDVLGARMPSPVDDDEDPDPA